MRNKSEIRDEQRSRLPTSTLGFYDKAYKGSRANAIKAKCLECCLNVRDEVSLCKVYTCPLYEVRPYQKVKAVE